MTARQFLMLGQDPPGVRLELVDGEIAVSPSPIPDHSYVDTQLRTILNTHVQARGLGMIFGDVDTIFGEHAVRRPDIICFSKSRLHLIGPKAMEGSPDLCVEILGPGSVRTDRKDKFKQCAEAGVRFYWIVDLRSAIDRRVSELTPPEARPQRHFRPACDRRGSANPR
jgi:Uma2 family endonuclease